MQAVRLSQYFFEAAVLRAEVDSMGVPKTDIKYTMVQNLTHDYKGAKLIMCRDCSFDLSKIQSTMRHLCLDNLSCRNETETRIAGRGAIMAVSEI